MKRTRATKCMMAVALSTLVGSATMAKASPTKQQVSPAVGPRLILVINTNRAEKQQASARRISVSVRKISQFHTRIEHYAAVDTERVSKIRPAGIILSGQGTPWDDYPAGSLDGITKFIKRAKCPILGICGGHQLIALAYGGRVDRIKRLRPGHGYNGCFREQGFVPVTVIAKDPLLGGSGNLITVLESHYDEVKGVPTEFIVTARNSTCKVQAMRHISRPISGVQFHPESQDNTHLDGQKILKRFLDTCMTQSECSK